MATPAASPGFTAFKKKDMRMQDGLK